jgi:hypothetical protein
MGLPMVLLFWAAFGTIAAVLGAATLGGLAALLTRSAPGRRRLVVAASLFPFACLAWGGGVFVFQALVNEGLLHRDLGLGDTWHAPLPNGYQIMMIDVTDQGWVYNPKTQTGSSITDREDAVSGVRTLQVSGQYILGGTDSKGFEHLGKNVDTVDGYFVLDTRLGKRDRFASLEALRQKAGELGIAANLQPINDVYGGFRFTWFDVFAGLLLCLPPLAAFLLLGRWVLRVRRTRPLQSHAA